MNNNFIEFSQRYYDFISNIDYRILIGVIVLISTYAIELFLMNKGILSFKNNKRKMEKAVKLNHIIKAKRVSYYDDDPYKRHKDSYFHAKYEYEFNGKKMKYWYLGKIVPPYVITLYYINNPKKAFHYEEKDSPLIILTLIIPIIIAYCVMKILGYN